MPAEKRNVFIFRRPGCDKDSLLSDEKLKKKKNWRICFVLPIVVHGHFAISGSRYMSSHSKSHKISVDGGYSVYHHKHLRNSTKELWAVYKAVNMREICI